jgi:hypothetical protein
MDPPITELWRDAAHQGNGWNFKNSIAIVNSYITRDLSREGDKRGKTPP